jgi:hypothetical protein
MTEVTNDSRKVLAPRSSCYYRQSLNRDATKLPIDRGHILPTSTSRQLKMAIIFYYYTDFDVRFNVHSYPTISHASAEIPNEQLSFPQNIFIKGDY